MRPHQTAPPSAETSQLSGFPQTGQGCCRVTRRQFPCEFCTPRLRSGGRAGEFASDGRIQAFDLEQSFVDLATNETNEQLVQIEADRSGRVDHARARLDFEEVRGVEPDLRLAVNAL